MKAKRLFTTFVLIFSILMGAYSQEHTDANIFGHVKSSSDGEHIPFATVYIEGTTIGTTTDETGHYMLIDLEPGTLVLVAKSMGYSTVRDTLEVTAGKSL